MLGIESLVPRLHTGISLASAAVVSLLFCASTAQATVMPAPTEPAKPFTMVPLPGANTLPAKCTMLGASLSGRVLFQCPHNSAVILDAKGHKTTLSLDDRGMAFEGLLVISISDTGWVAASAQCGPKSAVSQPNQSTPTDQCVLRWDPSGNLSYTVVGGLDDQPDVKAINAHGDTVFTTYVDCEGGAERSCYESSVWWATGETEKIQAASTNPGFYANGITAKGEVFGQEGPGTAGHRSTDLPHPMHWSKGTVAQPVSANPPVGASVEGEPAGSYIWVSSPSGNYALGNYTTRIANQTASYLFQYKGLQAQPTSIAGFAPNRDPRPEYVNDQGDFIVRCSWFDAAAVYVEYSVNYRNSMHTLNAETVRGLGKGRYAAPKAIRADGVMVGVHGAVAKGDEKPVLFKPHK